MENNMKITVNKDKEIEKAQDTLDNCNEAISVLDNAIKCGFLFDNHSLTCQKWIKEYEHRIDYLNNFLEGARNG